MRSKLIAILLLALTSNAVADLAPGCASTLGELRVLVGDPGFSKRWEEISMDDGKPLVVSIFERRGVILLEFVKSGEGLWAEIGGIVCKAGEDFEVRAAKEHLKLGADLPWIISGTLANGGAFTLRRHKLNALQIETIGWQGRFVASPSE